MSGGLGFILDIAQSIQTGIKLGAKLDGTGGAGDAELNAAVSDIFSSALGECGTEGQISLIEEIGFDGFMAAAGEAAGGGDATDALEASCSHPEAVMDILEMAGGDISDAVSDILSDQAMDPED